jgi:Lar family restriction alleviation protein
MTIKLKPCPFCGARSVIGNGPRLTDFESLHRRIYEVHCEQCNATINRWFDSEQEAAEAWNKRAERIGYWKQATPFVDTIECSECGYQWPEPEMASKYCPDCGALMLMDEEVGG